jgi:hypothetical protein
MEIISIALFSAFFMVILNEYVYLGYWKAWGSLVCTSIAELILWDGSINHKVVNAVAGAFLSLVIMNLIERFASE